MEALPEVSRPVRRLKWSARNVIIATLALGCGTLTAVSVQQARTIEAQQTLIRQLFQDSIQLGALRMQRHAIQHDQ